MRSRMKEEERIERTIRELLKLQENRRCINCNSLGPQYVCTNFWTFICTNCSGVHREFTHRVKSVSIAKFDTEELGALQAGGNERARQIYFKAWDPEHHSLPDGSNRQRLREFIKNVYLDQKYAGERSIDKLPMVKVGAKKNPYEHHSIERYSPSGGKDEKNLSYFEERRSPCYKQENVRSGGHRSHPVHFEIVDNRIRDNGTGSGRKSETRRFSNPESSLRSMSLDSKKSREIPSLPPLRDVRDILGQNIPHLWVGQHRKANDENNTNSSAQVQMTASSSCPGYVDGKLLEDKRLNLGSLIDFSTDLELFDTIEAPQTGQTVTSTDGGTLALGQSSTKDKASDVQIVNSVESLLFGLSSTAVETVGVVSEAAGGGTTPSTAPAALSGSVVPTLTGPRMNFPAAPYNYVTAAPASSGMTPALAVSSGDSLVKVTAGQQVPTIQQHQLSSISSLADSDSIAQKIAPTVGTLYNQQWTSSLTPNTQGPACASAKQSSQSAFKPAQDTGYGVSPLAVQDLFTGSDPLFSAPIPSRQNQPPLGMGFGMLDHHTAMVPTFPNSAKSTNPFDLSDERTKVQDPVLPSMSSLQGALPVLSAPAGLLHTSSSGVHSSQPMQSQSSHSITAVTTRSTSYGRTMAPSEFMGQQLSTNMPSSRPEGISSFGGIEAAFGSLNPINQPNGRYWAPATTDNSSTLGGTAL